MGNPVVEFQILSSKPDETANFYAQFLVALLPIALASGESLTAHTLHGWLVLFALAWLSQVAGQSAITWSLAHLPAAFGAVTLLVNPLAAALFAWATLGERIGPLQAVGGAVVLIGIALARQGSVVSRAAD